MRGYGWLYGPFIQAAGVDIEWTLTLKRDVHFLQAVMAPGDGHFVSDPPSFSRTTSDELFIDKAKIRVRHLGGGPCEFMLAGAHFYSNPHPPGSVNPADRRLVVVVQSDLNPAIMAIGTIDPYRADEASIKDLTVEYGTGGEPPPMVEFPVVRKIKVPPAYSHWNLLAMITHLRLDGSTLAPL